MGRQTIADTAAQQRLSTRPTSTGTALRMGRVGLFALSLGIGAVVAAGTANADGAADNGTGRHIAHSSPVSTRADAAEGPRSLGPSVAKAHKAGLSSVPTTKLGNGRRVPSIAPTNLRPSPRIRSEGTATRAIGDTPAAPMPTVQAVLQLVSREIERFTFSVDQVRPRAASPFVGVNAVPSIAPGAPAPTDRVPTVYGDIGKWMLQSNGQISDYGGLPHEGRTVLEPVNVIIVDPTSTSAAEAACKLNTVMFWSGFPAQPIHSTGFQGTIDDVTYGQQPVGLLLGFSDNFFLFPNNHGRIFGPDPVETSTGYVWSGAFSTEEFVIYDLLPRHAYVSSNLARNALAMRLIASGQATYGGMVPLNNAYNTAGTTTGDHDGYAVVLILK